MRESHQRRARIGDARATGFRHQAHIGAGQQGRQQRLHFCAAGMLRQRQHLHALDGSRVIQQF